MTRHLRGLPLFEQASEPAPFTPKWTGTTPETRDTSREAAERIEGGADILRERVYRAIRDAGASGMTDAELQAHLDIPGNTERPRRVELHEAHRIAPSGEKRRTASGRSAVVWVVRAGPA